MDEIGKAKLRNRARILHWVTELVLFVSFAVAVTVGLIWHAGKDMLADTFLDLQLASTSEVEMAEFTRFYFGRGEQLFAYPPPENCAEREAWAKKIAEDFRQPVAVFVRDCCGLEWIACPPEFVPGRAHVERYLAGNSEKKDHAQSYASGMMARQRVSFGSDTLGFTADIVGPLNDSLRWGIVRRFQDTWRAFYTSLNDPQTMVGPNHPAHVLQRVVLLPSNLTQVVPQFRVSSHGEVLFASPQLDTTRHKYVIDSPPQRFEYYATKDMVRYATLMKRPLVSWKSYLLPLLLMLVVHVYWLWIKKLTKPGETT